MRSKLKILVLALLALAMPMAAQAQAPAASAERELKIHADKMDYDETKKMVRLVGHVRFETADAVMTAPYAQYHTGKQVAEFQGGVKITQPGSTLVGNKMTVWYGEKRGVLTGNVRLVSEKAPGSDGRAPTTMTAREIEYRWEKGIGEARGDVKVRQGDKRAFAETATYDRNGQTIDMAGNVRFEQGQDDWLTSDRARVDLAADTITAQGQVVGRFILDEQQPAPAAPPVRPLPAPEAVEPEIPVQPVEAAPPAPLPGLEQ